MRSPRALVVVASVALLLALAAGYVRRAVVDSDQFANRASAVLRDDAVKSLIAERITDQLVLRQDADLIAARPIIESFVGEVVGGGAFRGLFRSGIRDVHRALFDRDRHTLTLTVADVGTVVAGALQVVKPDLAKRLGAAGRVQILTRDIGAASATAVRIARTVRLLAWGLLVLALLLTGAALRFTDDRRQTSLDLGLGAAAGGVLLVIACGIGRRIAVDAVSGEAARAAARAVWDAFLGDLRTAGWIYAGAGAVIAAAADSLLRPIDIAAHARQVGQWLITEPKRPRWRAVRSLGLIGAGALVLLDRAAVLTVFFTLGGVYLIYAGVSGLLWLAYQPRHAERPHELEETKRWLVAIPIAAVLIVVAGSIFVGSGGVTAAAPPRAGCEGHVELCNRRLDAVALPATHNSMSAPLPGWFSSEQDRPIAQQLQDGIRGLLIDTHYADRLPNGKLRTNAADLTELRQKGEQDGIGKEAIAAALRIRDRLGFAGQGKRGMYLCHALCELGGTPLAQVLGQLHDFLVANPDEVVVVVNQDYVTPADFVRAVDDAGLSKLAYRGPVTGPWPTLRELIDSRQRVVFLAENHAGAAPWYRLAYQSALQETPFAFGKVAQLTDPAQLDASCAPNRGPDTAQLFLVNHWVSTDPLPLPSNAAKVNAYAPLMRRLRDCQRIRHHLPNLVAVNFYRRGDLFKAVDTLNGLP